jgi:hypothetical protein
MKRYLQLITLSLFPLILTAVPDSLKTSSSPIKRWDITASIGYGLPFAKQVLGGVGTVDSNSTTEAKSIRGTFGKGIFSFLSVGYKVNQHFGSEFGIHSTFGNRIMTYQVTNIAYGSKAQKFTQISTIGLFVGFFLADTYSKFHISLHNDFLVGLMNRATEESFANGIPDPVWKYSGRISYGWLSRFGGSYDISNKMNIGLSGFFVLHSWSPLQKETLNGQNKITFSDDTLSNGIYPLPSNQLPRVTYPLHVCGISVSVSYCF